MDIKIVTSSGQTENRSYKDWEVKAWVDCLMEAEEIKADPAKMALIKPHLGRKEKVLKSLKDLKKLASSKIAREDQYQAGPEKSGQEMSDDMDEMASKGDELAPA